MRPSESLFFDIRGLRYHVRAWGPVDAPRLFMLHGWMDVSASFQFVVDALRGPWRVLAPDWRGYGLTDRGGGDCYWFPDYVADLDRLLDALSPEAPAHLAGHSMGGNVACLYAGVRPARVATLINLEGFGLTATQSRNAPRRYARWLDELRDPPGLRDYESFDALAARLRQQNPRLTAERAAFLARHWGGAGGGEEGGESGGRVVLRGDPAHKIVNPVQYQLEEARACWRAVTAPVLWIQGAETATPGMLGLSAADVAERKACFSNLTERVLPDCGHMLHHDQPARLAEEIEAFLAACAGGGPLGE
jgi:pimeloyl-ACP methyl ester carboxylesterase